MMTYYEELTRFSRDDGFDVIVDMTHEDIHPRDCFDVDDVAEICRKIDQGIYEWFRLRVRVLFEGHEFGSAHLGACCYEDAKETLKDGTADDMIAEAVAEARRAVGALKERLALFAV